MKKKSCNKSALFIYLSLIAYPFQLHATVEPKKEDMPKRIQSLIIDRGEVSKISLVPGLGSIMLFPCSIDEVFLGRQSEVSVQVSPTTKNSVLLSLKSWSSEPTNLFVKCKRARSYFVFDLISSHSLHQDLIEIRAAVGAPTMSGGSIKEIDSSERSVVNEVVHEKRSPTIVIQKPVLIESNESL